MLRLAPFISIFIFGGCDCLFFPEPGGTGGGGEGGGSERPKPHEQCITAMEELTGFDAVTTALEQPGIADGQQDVPITPQGCIFLRRQYAAGVLTGWSVRRYSGFDTILDGGYPDFVIGELEYVYVDFTAGPGRTKHVTADLDVDSVRDLELDEQWTGTQLDRRVSTVYGSSGAISRRTTLTSVTADTIHYKVEEQQMGALVVVEDRDAPARQKQKAACYMMPKPAGPSDVVPCTLSDMQIKKRIHDSLKRTKDCLKSVHGNPLGVDQFEAFMLDRFTIDDLQIECFRDPTYFGEAKTDSNVLKLNVDMLGCDDADFIDSTITHELMHFSRGPHDFDHDTITGPYGPRAHTYTDSIRACEALCYGTLKTKCTCAKCFETLACDIRCQSFGSCTQKNDAGVYTMSQAVGARCESDNAWFATMMGCTATNACSGGASKCKSYSLSCDPNCQ